MGNLFWVVILFFITLSLLINGNYEYFEDLYNHWLISYKSKSEKHFEVKQLMKKMIKQNCKFQVYPDIQNGLRGLYSTKNLPIGAVIISVPTEAVYWCTISQSDLSLCATKLAIEIYQGKDSKFYEQIQAAPTLKEFKTHMIHYQPKLVKKFKYLFSKEILNFIDKKFQIKLPDKNEQWAYMILNSRAFNAYDWFAWVGVIDLINHSPFPNAEMDATKPNIFRIIATEKIKKGEEILIEYHNGTNPELLSTYGFADSLNKNVKKLSKFKCKKLKKAILEEKENPKAKIFIQLANEQCEFFMSPGEINKIDL